MYPTETNSRRRPLAVGKRAAESRVKWDVIRSRALLAARSSAGVENLESHENLTRNQPMVVGEHGADQDRGASGLEPSIAATRCRQGITRASAWIMCPLPEVCLGQVSLPLLLDTSSTAPTAPMTFTESQIVEILKEGGKRSGGPAPNGLNPASHPGLALAVCEVCALSDLDNVSVRIADVAANLAVLGNRLRDELGPSTLP